MSKKDKKSCSVAECFQAVIAMIPKLEGLIKAHKEIAEGYQIYRKNGGDEIPGIEKHLGFKEQSCENCEKLKKSEKKSKTKVPEEDAEAKKARKKDQ
jgi:hypothetical protein